MKDLARLVDEALERRRFKTEAESALARCALRVANATDGRTIHGAIVACRGVMVRAGTRECLATSCAIAAAAVGHSIAMSHHAALQELGIGQ